jgi:hypothetical protein
VQSTGLREWRHDTAACARRLHLNNAGASLIPRPVADAVIGQLALEQEMSIRAISTDILHFPARVLVIQAATSCKRAAS